MLEIRPCCEHCGKDLKYDSTEAMICTFECTYCKNCAIDIFENVCPNCGGGFSPRPVRPKQYLEKYPPSEKRIFKPKNLEEHQVLKNKLKNIEPHKR